VAAEWTSTGCPGSSDTGAFRLAWTGGEQANFRLEKLTEDAAPTLVYQGRDTATTVTGAREGDVSFRVGELVDGRVASWSRTCTVDVSPPSMTLAFTLFGLGTFVSICTVAVILRGHRAHRAGDIG
jgi:hypothetical protein